MNNEQFKINQLNGINSNNQNINNAQNSFLDKTLKIWAHKNSVKMSNLKSILVEFKGNDNTSGNNIKVFFSKRMCFTDMYVNTIDIFVFKDGKYNVYLPHNNNWKTPDSILTGEELYKLLSTK